MRLRLFTTSLFALFLLLGTLGCSKKDDPTASIHNTGTYTLDGVVTPCKAVVNERSGSAYNLNGDYLNIELIPTNPQQSGKTVILYFQKPLDAPASDYTLLLITLTSSLPQAPYGIDYLVPGVEAKLSKLSSGGYSGTFSATFSRFTSQVITAGAFTDARP